MSEFTIEGITNGVATSWVVRYVSAPHSPKLDYYRFLNQLRRDADMTYDLCWLCPDNEELNAVGFALDCALCAELRYNQERAQA